ncbi:MAG: hypothetical protein DWQ10_13320 [Calditrichaeota bacterium]|nr:MAG: hypothetical protein DWQ10_13320 [Calditrichota bacterium]
MGGNIIRNFVVSAKYLFLACVSSLVFALSCGEQHPTNVLSPNMSQDSQSMSLWKYGTPLTGEIKPIKWKPGMLGKTLGNRGEILGVFDAIILLQDFMANV